MRATIVRDLAGEVLLGRGVPLHEHMVGRLPKGRLVELLRQLARDSRMPLEGRPKDAVKTCGENPGKEDAVEMQEDIPDTQVEDPI